MAAASAAVENAFIAACNAAMLQHAAAHPRREEESLAEDEFVFSGSPGSVLGLTCLQYHDNLTAGIKACSPEEESSAEREEESEEDEEWCPIDAPEEPEWVLL